MATGSLITTSAVPYIGSVPTVSHEGNVFSLKCHSGGEIVELALSVKTVLALRDRLSDALDRYARGEEYIILG